MNEPKGVAGLTEMRKSYEYTLEKVGPDSGAGGLWQEFISFLQNPRTGSPAYQALFASQMPGQEEAQRVLWLRSPPPHQFLVISCVARLRPCSPLRYQRTLCASCPGSAPPPFFGLNIGKDATLLRPPLQGRRFMKSHRLGVIGGAATARLGKS